MSKSRTSKQNLEPSDILSYILLPKIDLYQQLVLFKKLGANSKLNVSLSQDDITL